jgi:hypothetical protein
MGLGCSAFRGIGTIAGAASEFAGLPPASPALRHFAAPLRIAPMIPLNPQRVERHELLTPDRFTSVTSWGSTARQAGALPHATYRQVEIGCCLPGSCSDQTVIGGRARGPRDGSELPSAGRALRWERPSRRPIARPVSCRRRGKRARSPARSRCSGIRSRRPRRSRPTMTHSRRPRPS